MIFIYVYICMYVYEYIYIYVLWIAGPQSGWTRIQLRELSMAPTQVLAYDPCPLGLPQIQTYNVYARIFMYVYIYVYMYVSVCVHIYIYTYVYK